MKFGVVVFPGSNCDHDVIYVIKKLLNQEVVSLWHKESSLQDCDYIILPGGFSYGDYLRSGAIARFSPIMEKVIDFANNGGYVMGICNGFQILCEARLLPGALLPNINHRFICRNTFIRTETSNSIITSKLNLGQVLKIPIAHGEGRYYASDAVLDQLYQNDQILFRYCNESGQPVDSANPNGSLQNIAGICNERRNVFGMMPHPERAADLHLGNTDGRAIFDAVVESMTKACI
ncbi:MAG TPA: phosphoribosylformylglycinamidine synthase subunit PurQ [Bacteroidales bacterium]|nr:phosphoribosylformylglycinamidine synthase subunit PurQ [Bacteroidales bacterium]